MVCADECPIEEDPRLTALQREIVASSRNTSHYYETHEALAASAAAGQCWKMLVWAVGPARDRLAAQIEAELDEDEPEEKMPAMVDMPTAEPYMSEISFAPSPKSAKLGSLDLGMDAQAAPLKMSSSAKKSGKYTSCKCADGNEIMLMR